MPLGHFPLKTRKHREHTLTRPAANMERWRQALRRLSGRHSDTDEDNSDGQQAPSTEDEQSFFDGYYDDTQSEVTTGENNDNTVARDTSSFTTAAADLSDLPADTPPDYFIPRVMINHFFAPWDIQRYAQLQLWILCHLPDPTLYDPTIHQPHWPIPMAYHTDTLASPQNRVCTHWVKGGCWHGSRCVDHHDPTYLLRNTCHLFLRGRQCSHPERCRHIHGMRLTDEPGALYQRHPRHYRGLTADTNTIHTRSHTEPERGPRHVWIRFNALTDSFYAPEQGRMKMSFQRGTNGLHAHQFVRLVARWKRNDQPSNNELETVQTDCARALETMHEQYMEQLSQVRALANASPPPPPPTPPQETNTPNTTSSTQRPPDGEHEHQETNRGPTAQATQQDEDDPWCDLTSTNQPGAQAAPSPHTAAPATEQAREPGAPAASSSHTTAPATEQARDTEPIPEAPTHLPPPTTLAPIPPSPPETPTITPTQPTSTNSDSATTLLANALQVQPVHQPGTNIVQSIVPITRNPTDLTEPHARPDVYTPPPWADPRQAYRRHQYTLADSACQHLFSWLTHCCTHHATKQYFADNLTTLAPDNIQATGIPTENRHYNYIYELRHHIWNRIQCMDNHGQLTYNVQPYGAFTTEPTHTDYILDPSLLFQALSLHNFPTYHQQTLPRGRALLDWCGSLRHSNTPYLPGTVVAKSHKAPPPTLPIQDEPPVKAAPAPPPRAIQDTLPIEPYPTPGPPAPTQPSPTPLPHQTPYSVVVERTVYNYSAPPANAPTRRPHIEHV